MKYPLGSYMASVLGSGPLLHGALDGLLGDLAIQGSEMTPEAFEEWFELFERNLRYVYRMPARAPVPVSSWWWGQGTKGTGGAKDSDAPITFDGAKHHPLELESAREAR